MSERVSEFEIVFDDPQVLASRLDLTDEVEAERAKLDSVNRKRDEAVTLMEKLKSGTASSREVQTALAYVLQIVAGE